MDVIVESSLEVPMGNLSTFVINAPIGILPVLSFLAALQYLDSFKLLRLRFILWMIAAGGMLAIAAYHLNGEILGRLEVEFLTYARYVAPGIEEALKASALIYLLMTRRIGFLVDAAIVGFAIGAGFAVVENFVYLMNTDANTGIWIVRGFGTAIMHGGVTAIFGIITMGLLEKHEKLSITYLLPGFILATIIHSAFNHFFFSPIFSTLAVFVLLPPFMYLIFERSTASLHDWLELDFDADADLIAQLNSGEFQDTHVGEYLRELRSRFEGMIIVDMLCYLRVYTELSMRAKGAMMMRQHGLEMPHDPTVEASFEEMRYLESSIGKTGLLAIDPFLEINRRDLWHLNSLETSHG
jgi:RsiW-degrading membrane proteinase PrsW (M82 family)